MNILKLAPKVDMSDGHRKAFRWMTFLSQMFGDPRMYLNCYPQTDGSVYYEYKSKVGDAVYYFHVFPDGNMTGGLRADGMQDIYG